MRKVVTLLHRYIGLALGAFLFVSALTGSAIVFSKAVDGFLNPELHAVQPGSARVPIDAVLGAARRAVPHDVPSFIFLSRLPDETVEVMFEASGMRAYVNPYTGGLLGSRHERNFFTGFLIDLHVHLLAGETGEQVAGWAGVGLIVLSMLGVWLWWPKRGRWNAAFAVKWRAAAFRRWFDLHRVVGVCAAAFLILTAATGASLALYDIITEPALVALTGKGARLPAPKSSLREARGAPIEPMLRQAAALFPEGEATRIGLPSKEDGAVSVRMRLEGEVHQYGRTFLWFDRYDGTLLRVDNALTAHRAIRIQSWLYPLHTGFYGGILTRWLQVLVGLSLVMLSLSGAWLWLRRRSAAAPEPAAGRRKAPDG